MDFTTMDDTAEYTAKVATDEASPRYLRIAGDQLNVKEIANIMTQLTGKKHGLIRAGSVGFLNLMIKAFFDYFIYPSFGEMFAICFTELHHWGIPAGTQAFNSFECE